MRSTLRTALYVFGGLLLLGAFWLPPLAIYGAVLLLGLAFETWRYKPPQTRSPDPRWQDTGERFVDPGSDALTAVYYDPASGERHYVKVEREVRSR